MPTPAAAAAATKCTGEQHKEIDTVGPNLDLYITLCVTRDSSNNLKAHASVRWSDGGGGASAGMEKIDVKLHLQRYDADYRIKTHNYAAATNLSESGKISHSTDSYNSGSAGGWTADAKVWFDIQNDGAGDMTWGLGGTPAI